MNKVSAFLYFALLITVNFANKFVLSVLGFRYPMVFQGWQMLVGFLLYKILSATKTLSFASIPMDRAGFISLLPNFLFFTSGIISGSKALASIPLITFLSVANLMPASLHLVDAIFLKKSPATARSFLASAVVLGSGLSLLVTEPKGELAASPYFWLLIHLVCSTFYTLHGRIADVRFNSVDRQYYSYIFSLIVLAPASLYLEEAFEALHFQEGSQVMFLLGSAVSAVAGVVLHLYQSRLRNDANFGRVHHVGLFLTALASLVPFEHDYAGYHSLGIALVNMFCLVFVPTSILPDEEKLSAETSAMDFEV